MIFEISLIFLILVLFGKCFMIGIKINQNYRELNEYDNETRTKVQYVKNDIEHILNQLNNLQEVVDFDKEKYNQKLRNGYLGISIPPLKEEEIKIGLKQENQRLKKEIDDLRGVVNEMVDDYYGD